MRIKAVFCNGLGFTRVGGWKCTFYLSLSLSLSLFCFSFRSALAKRVVAYYNSTQRLVLVWWVSSAVLAVVEALALAPIWW